MLGYLPLDINCSSKLTVFRERKVRLSQQIMSKDKYPCIFPHQMEAIVYIAKENGKSGEAMKTRRSCNLFKTK